MVTILLDIREEWWLAGWFLFGEFYYRHRNLLNMFMLINLIKTTAFLAFDSFISSTRLRFRCLFL